MEEYREEWRRLGYRIAEMRMRRKITQSQLAEMTGHSRVYIGYIEQGKRCGPIHVYMEIVEALGYTMNDLVRQDLEEPVSLLLTEISVTLDHCEADEKESAVRILRGLLSIMRMIRGERP